MKNNSEERQEQPKVVKPLRKLMHYLKHEICLFAFGILGLLVASIGDVSVPLYIGWVIDNLKSGQFDKISPLCL